MHGLRLRACGRNDVQLLVQFQIQSANMASRVLGLRNELLGRKFKSKADVRGLYEEQWAKAFRSAVAEMTNQITSHPSVTTYETGNDANEASSEEST